MRSTSTMNEPFTFSYVARAAPDVPGQWIAHCLDLDIVTQGESFKEAMMSICEAVDMALEEGAPEGYSRAPEKFWELFKRISETGERAEMEDLFAREASKMAHTVVVGMMTVFPTTESKRPTEVKPSRRAWSLPSQQAQV
jgi:hypothetical protein